MATDVRPSNRVIRRRTRRRIAGTGDAYVANDISLTGPTCQLVVPDRPVWAAESNLPASDRVSCAMAQAGRSCGRSSRIVDRIFGEGRCVRQYRARTLGVHGGDAGPRTSSTVEKSHWCSLDDWVHLRRPQHRGRSVGAPATNTRRRAEDIVSPRIIASRPDLAGRDTQASAEFHVAARRVEGRHRLFLHKIVPGQSDRKVTAFRWQRPPAAPPAVVQRARVELRDARAG